MIRFFGRIRLRLLAGNKVSKYLLYASGEIILVSAGILIALQINTWNENGKKNRQAEIYLADLRDDINFDIQKLNERISDNQEKIDNLHTINFTFATRSELSKQELLELINLHLVLTTESYYIPEKSTIRQIEASSHGSLLKNKKLRDKLFRYYSTNDRNEKNQEESTQLYQHLFITEHIIKGIMLGAENAEALFGNNLNRPYTDYNKLTQNEDYITALAMKNQNTIFQNQQYELMKILAVDLLQLIEFELNEVGVED